MARESKYDIHTFIHTHILIYRINTKTNIYAEYTCTTTQIATTKVFITIATI